MEVLGRTTPNDSPLVDHKFNIFIYYDIHWTDMQSRAYLYICAHLFIQIFVFTNIHLNRGLSRGFRIMFNIWHTAETTTANRIFMIFCRFYDPNTSHVRLWRPPAACDNKYNIKANTKLKIGKQLYTTKSLQHKSEDLDIDTICTYIV